jgi:hypothetical protein
MSRARAGSAASSAAMRAARRSSPRRLDRDGQPAPRPQQIHRLPGLGPIGARRQQAASPPPPHGRALGRLGRLLRARPQELHRAIEELPVARCGPAPRRQRLGQLGRLDQRLEAGRQRPQLHQGVEQRPPGPVRCTSASFSSVGTLVDRG